MADALTMNKKEAPGAWLIVGVLFISWFLVWGGGLNTGAVFFPPVLKHFGWSRATLSGAFAVGAALSHFTGRSWLWSASRQLLILGIAAAVTYGVGHLVGTG